MGLRPVKDEQEREELYAKYLAFALLATGVGLSPQWGLEELKAMAAQFDGILDDDRFILWARRLGILIPNTKPFITIQKKQEGDVVKATERFRTARRVLAAAVQTKPAPVQAGR